MKVKEKIYERRGRPRKYTMGEVRYRVLWAPENLLLELRIALFKATKFASNLLVVLNGDWQLLAQNIANDAALCFGDHSGDATCRRHLVGCRLLQQLDAREFAEGF